MGGFPKSAIGFQKFMRQLQLDIGVYEMFEEMNQLGLDSYGNARQRGNKEWQRSGTSQSSDWGNSNIGRKATACTADSRNWKRDPASSDSTVCSSRSRASRGDHKD